MTMLNKGLGRADGVGLARLGPGSAGKTWPNWSSWRFARSWLVEPFD